MRYVTDAAQMKEIDRRTSEEVGIEPAVLMEKAAERIAECAALMLGGDTAIAGKRIPAPPGQDAAVAGKRILAVYGAGGNGGDAVAAARLLHLKGAAVCLCAADGKEPCALTKKQLSIAEKCGVPRQEQTCNDMDFSAYDMILDGIFGIGLSREVAGAYRLLIGRINASGVPVLSIDIPSGIHAGTGECLGTAVRAACTVTFGEYKIGHFLYPGTMYCGRLMLGDAGFVPRLTGEVLRESACRCITYEASDAAGLLPERVPRSHKGSYGRVLIYAGSARVTGAAYLAAKAAYRCGVGLVKLVSAKECVDIVRQMLPEALYEVIPDAEQEKFWNEQALWADAVLAGPGIGTGADAAEALRLLAAAAGAGKKPLVLDADALNLMAQALDETPHLQERAGENGEEAPHSPERAGRGRNGEDAPYLQGRAGKNGEEVPEAVDERLRRLAEMLPEYTILTPHPKELSRLTGLSVQQITEHLIDTAKQCIYNNKLIYVLKDARTIVACGGELYINRSGCDGMACGGSGDVLAGMIAGLCVGKEPPEAARAGVFLHGLAGERAQAKCGCRAMLAGDILDGMLLPEAESFKSI